MTEVLVINAGSSSLKYALIDSETGTRIASGIVERIGERVSVAAHSATERFPERTAEILAPDHDAAFADVSARLDELRLGTPDVVGHRIVHGGSRFTRPTLIDKSVIEAIADCVPLAPLHNPAGLEGIEAALCAYPGVPQVAVFDTAFHATIPGPARTYAIDRDAARRFRLHRYGFHGTSHQYVGRRAAAFLGVPVEEFDVVTLHLGNGASACAIRGGRSIETSMGVTPLEGLVMGTRSGDIDPSIPALLGRAGWSAEDVDQMLNRESGLLGLCGDNDLREIHRRADAGDESAELARQTAAHRVRKYLGAYVFTLGRADAVVFTAGIGEHDAWMRARVCDGLSGFGIALDPTANAGGSGTRDISTADGAVRVLVVPTDEERAIAEESAGVSANSG